MQFIDPQNEQGDDDRSPCIVASPDGYVDSGRWDDTPARTGGEFDPSFTWKVEYHDRVTAIAVGSDGEDAPGFVAYVVPPDESTPDAFKKAVMSAATFLDRVCEADGTYDPNGDGPPPGLQVVLHGAMCSHAVGCGRGIVILFVAKGGRTKQESERLGLLIGSAVMHRLRGKDDLAAWMDPGS